MTLNSEGDVRYFSNENICTCTFCAHKLSKECLAEGCNCCEKESHQLVMDGIEGFQPRSSSMR